MDICIECDEESKDGHPITIFGVCFKDDGGKKSYVHTYQAVLSSKEVLAEKLRSYLT